MKHKRHWAGKMMILFVLAALLAACARASQQPVIEQKPPTRDITQAFIPRATLTLAPTQPPPSQYTEAPELAALVAIGHLPPLKERLPEHPLVLKPADSTGVYGGTLRRLLMPSGDAAQFIRTVNYESLVTWTPGGAGIQPDIAESYEVSEDAAQYTFHLRKGMYWSDGAPFTSVDLRFYWEDIILNEDLTPSVPAWFKVNSELPKVTFPDETTMVIKWSSPNGLFLSYLAGPDGMNWTAYPAHWCKQFHAKYTGEPRSVKWVDTFWSKTFLDGSQPSRPTLFAWILVDPYASGVGRVTFKRNPFYWKVDTIGQQLPYINEVVFAVVDNINAMIPKVLNGEVDMQERHINAAKNKSLFIDYAKRGDYRLFNLYSASLNQMTIMLNLNHEDPVKREIFNNKAFRIGLSYAINRQEIIDAVFEGTGEPWQTAPSRNSPFYDEDMAKQYTEYSPEKANEYLDRAGYPKDTSGKRIGPDGRPISFLVEVTNNQPEWLDMLNMVSTYWAAVGIRMQPALEDRALFNVRKANNQHDAAVWSSAGFLVDVLLDPRYFLPSSVESTWASQWVEWFQNPIRAAEFEPPERVKQAMMIFWSIKDTANVEEQINLAEKIVQFAKEEFWTIGIASAYDGYGIVKNNLHNVIDHPAGWIYPNPAPIHPETWYYDPPQK